MADDDVIDTMEAVVAAQTATEKGYQQTFRERLHEASLVANIAETPPIGRLKRAKSIIFQTIWPSTLQQADFNAKIIDALGSSDQAAERLAQRLDALEANSTETWGAIHARPAGVESINAAIRATVAGHEVILDEMAQLQQTIIDDLASIRGQVIAADEQSGPLGESVVGALASIASLQRHASRIDADLSEARARLDLTLRSIRERADEPVSRTLEQVSAARSAEFYSIFEEHFRGSRANVKETLRTYEVDLERLGRHGPVVDVGPGRCEWLELLSEHGISAYGVDTNKAFVDQGTALGLDIRHGDAVEHMKGIPSGSLGAVTAFHVAEHLDVDTLLDLLQSAFVALKPGGMVLLETPNPTNLMVGAASFYLDPTHLRPLHPDLLRFLVMHTGFCEVETRFLNPGLDVPQPASDEPLTSDMTAWMNWVLHGPRDFAVLATKPGAAASGA